ncbi:hypothetical protein TRVA0_035S00144 [Trichomonascus vanleenenianus]|uniref:Zn(II)2Cys6 transcription factor domain-containing protein n=1 Tax=Trichomonascus vanleenenianus TaxID=2268995 RepID=UPI003ECA9ADC
MHHHQAYSRRTDEDGRKKRVGKACDSCRMKKTKCDGRKPCSKCALDDKLCTYSEKKKQPEKTYSSSYVDLLESRLQLLQDGILKIVTKLANGEDVAEFVPEGEITINNVIELLSDDPHSMSDHSSYSHDHHHSQESLRQHDEEEQEQTQGMRQLPTKPLIKHDSSEEDSPVYGYSSPEELDTAVAPPELSPDFRPLGTELDPMMNLEDLNIGPFKSAAAMAAAAAASMAGGVYGVLPESPGCSSPDCFTPDTNLSWAPSSGTVSPSMLGESPTNISPSFLTRPPRHDNNGHLSRVHKAGSISHMHPGMVDVVDHTVNPPYPVRRAQPSLNQPSRPTDEIWLYN